ncbi:MAG: hypothetical protein OEZ34_12740 [Spirochaetia bacterium]|nr:hypothetical protein [Spirochaetia bacterium]
MNEDLLLILSNPFPQDKRLLGFAREEHRSDSILKAKPNEKFSSFREPLTDVMSPHIENAKAIQKIFFSGEDATNSRISAGKAGIDLNEKLLEIDKFFRTYIETAKDDLIENEARRLEKRYFEKTGVPSQLNFIKMKRFYEKLKTFNESATKIWKEIYGIINSLSLSDKFSKISNSAVEEHIEPSLKLSRFTDLFLTELHKYLKIESEGVNKNTGAHIAELSYDPYARYNLAGFFGDTADNFRDGSFQNQDSIPENIKKSSIAKNIVLETREQKLNRSSTFSTAMLGSRDWNRTTDYYMELAAQEYEESLELFRRSYHVSLTDEDRNNPVSSSSAVLRKSIGDEYLEPYINMLYGKLHDISALLITSDFPGLDHPLVFLYHCGPVAFLNILHLTLQQERIGEIFYLKKDRSTERTYPESILKREIIEWWNDTFKDLSGEDVDSYVLYSRALEMIKKDFRAVYEEGINIRMRETGKGHVGLDLWLKENQKRIYGIRKLFVFKRFIGNIGFD